MALVNTHHKTLPTRFIAIALLASMAPTIGFAQEYHEQLIVSGSRIETSATNLPGSHYAIEAEELTQRAKQSAIDLLRTVPGIKIGQQGGAGGVSVLYLRGGEPNFTAVMIDGVMVNDPTNSRGGSFDFSSLSLSAIERIELVNGPGSALYGSGPLSGSINIITRSGTRDEGHFISAAAGADGYWTGQFSTAGELGETNYRLTLGSSDFGEQTPGSTFDSHYASGKLTTRALNAAVSWVFRYADSSRTSFPEDSGGPQLAIIRALDDEQLQDFSTALRADWQLHDNLSAYTKVSWYSHEGDFFSPGIEASFGGVPLRGDDTKYERTDLEAVLLWSAHDTLDLVTGLNAQWEDGKNDGFLIFDALETDFALNRESLGLMFEARLSPTEKLILSAGVRVDDADSAGTQTNHAIGAVWQLGDSGSSLYANFATGFKLPSFFALGHALVGNPDLMPEESDTWQLGLRSQLMQQRLSLAVELYSSEFKNLIDFDEQLFTNVNRSLVESRGVDLSASYKPESGSFSIRAFVSYLDLDVVSSDDVLRGRPRWHAGVSAYTQLSAKLGLNLDYGWNDTTIEAALPLQSPSNPSGLRALSAYNRVDLALTADISANLRAQLAVDNLLDERYEEAVGFEALGINSRISLKYSF